MLLAFLLNKSSFPFVQNFIHSVNDGGAIDTLEFAPGHPNVKIKVLDQLARFPDPQFSQNHCLLPNFLWMDPSYLSGNLQPNYNRMECVKKSTQLQAALANYWNYYFIVNTNLKANKSYRDTNSFSGSWVKYANMHKHIPTAAISFWAQIQPFKIGDSCNAKLAYVYNNQQPDSCYVHNNKGALISRKYVSPLTPIALLQCDFATQAMYVDCLLNVMQRPLQMINENGEVFRVYDDDFLAQDARIAAAKNKYTNMSWNEFQAMKRLEKEIAYKNSFMLKPALANCLYSEYAIDGQNDYRHDYKTMRNVNSKINNQNYATPDFYPRYPYNWKDWQGPWHGLKWIEICRNTEIELGDNLFSPFVAAGWDSIETNNIRPAQWLGLLKILGAMGAEYYYAGFFNTGKSIAIPENYIWQAAMPVYAQAVTSYYEDILRNGKLMKADKFIQYPENDVPVVVRKSNEKKIWVIACTWQTGSNYNKNIGIEKAVSIDLGHKTIIVKARRQGSVYVYNEEGAHPSFYQIDAWHEYMHPYYWNQNIVLEAELFSKNIYTITKEIDDYKAFTTAAKIETNIKLPFQVHGDKKSIKQISLWIKNESNNNNISITLDNISIGKITLKNENKYLKYSLEIQKTNNDLKNGKHDLTIDAAQKELLLDKIEIEIN